MTTKICGKCRVNKNVNEFYKKSISQDGRQSICKECDAQYCKDNKELISKRKKDYYQDNKETISAHEKVYREDNKEVISKRKKGYYQDNREQILKRNIRYAKDNPDIARKCRARRLGWLSPQSINEQFEGSHLHHLHIEGNHQICIYIPAELHKSIWHAHNKYKTMISINLEIMKWYYGLTINWDLII